MFPQLTCRAIAAQFMAGGVIALFEFEQGKEGVCKGAERHYKLVLLEELSEEELERYRHRPDTA